MLKKINVTGFKSLDDFELEFHRGLNVIVGPNGSGKTNIINFVEFLSFLSRHPLLEAVSRSGGAGRIFRRDEYGALLKKIEFTLSGDGLHTDYRTGERFQVWYEYSAEISLSENNSALIYSSQTIKVAYGDHRDLLDEWPIFIEVIAGEKENDQILFHNIDPQHLRDAYTTKSKQGDEQQIRAAVEELLISHNRNSALFQLLDRYIRGSRQIISDLYGAKSYNISPSAVRLPEDIASEPEISEDGRGLAATLFALSNANKDRDFGFLTFGPHHYFEKPLEVLDQIISYSRIVNDSIARISVEPDTIENKLRIFLYVAYGNGRLKLPFSLVSDGTAKWFTLVTAILTSPTVFAIEEPENFLHPLMQKEIVKIVRQTFSSEEKDAFAVMTTHSETILNCVDPDELVLVHMEHGRTLAKRPSNSEDIREEIKSTGFGAGYYYLAGAIE